MYMIIANKITFFDYLKDKQNKIKLYRNIKYMNRLIFNKINYDYF